MEWIKAHVGHPGNEKADELAREAETKDISVTIHDSWANVKARIWQSVYQEWDIRWKEEDRFRQTKLFYPSPSHNKCKKLMNLTRPQMSQWIEIITGQNNLNYITFIILHRYVDFATNRTKLLHTF